MYKVVNLCLKYDNWMELRLFKVMDINKPRLNKGFPFKNYFLLLYCRYLTINQLNIIFYKLKISKK